MEYMYGKLLHKYNYVNLNRLAVYIMSMKLLVWMIRLMAY